MSQEQYQRWLAERLYADHKPAQEASEPTRSDQAEKVLHDQIIAECTKRGWVFFHSAMHRRTGRPPGEPDFQVFADRGRMFLVEAKAGSNTLTPEQKTVCAALAELGHKVHVVRSIEDFFQVINNQPKEKSP